MISTKLCFYLVASLGSVLVNAATAPTLSLPWGKYESAPFEKDKNLYLFRNVRFGANPPRFEAPSFPTSRQKDPGPADSISCLQVNPDTYSHPPGGRPNNGSTYQPPLFDPNPLQQEDCLFLDVYAPANAFDDNGNPNKNLPVIVWFHGGAFAFGSKNLRNDLPLYTGQAELAAQKYQAIWVVGNYRLGAFGWLAGSYMEQVGQPNAGLYDQALLLSWVQQYAPLVAGDPRSVSAWGESAGAGSIQHHLIREGGSVDPKFQTFLTQSPAFEWAWDDSPNGELDQIYLEFSYGAGCPAYDLACLQGRSTEELQKANEILYAKVKQTGMFPLGPAVDRKWVQTIPAVAYAEGKVWPAQRVRSALVSHVSNEAGSFIPADVNSKATFIEFVSRMFPQPQLKGVREEIFERYNCPGGDYHACAVTLVADAFFNCNTRDLFRAYQGKTYMLRYAFFSESLAEHATDLIPTFMNGYTDAYDILRWRGVNPVEAAAYAEALNLFVKARYQGYLSSFGVYGDPNKGAVSGALRWPFATLGSEISNVMEVSGKTGSWGLTSDRQNTQDTCGFWTRIAMEIMAVRGA